MFTQKLFKSAFCVGLLAVTNAASSVPERTSFSAKDTTNVDVAIIGGGATGTYAAVRLRDYGKSVLVIEKSGRLGGHTETYFANDAPAPFTGAPVNYGVQAWIASNLTSNFFSPFGIELIPVAANPSTPKYLDFKTGKPVPGYIPPSAPEVGAAVGKYLQILSQWPTLATGAYILPDPIPADLLLPFGDFVAKYQLQAILPLIFRFVHTVGTDLTKATTLFVVQTAGLPVMSAAVQGGFVVPADGVNIEVYLKAAQSLGGSVLYNSTLVDVNRHTNGLQQLIVSTPSGQKLIKAKKILVTIPPTLENLKPFYLDDHESSIFNQFTWTNYFTGVVQCAFPDGLSLVNTNPDTQYNLPIAPFIQNFDSTGISGLHTFHAVYDKPATTTDVSKFVAKALAQFSLAGTFMNSSALEVKLVVSHTPILFRVSADAVKKGFYTDLYGLQGRSGTFYTGQAWGSDYSTLLWGFTEGVLAQMVPLL